MLIFDIFSTNVILVSREYIMTSTIYIPYLLTACSEIIVTVRIEWLLLEYSFILCVPIDLFLIPVKENSINSIILLRNVL